MRRFRTDDYKVIPDPDAQILYEPLAYTDEALAQHERELCEDLEGEGATLLFNKDGTLPLAQDTKFSCFSQSSVNLLYGGTGSGSMDASMAATLHSALTAAFGEGCINQDLWTFYVTSGYQRENAATTGGHQGQYRINEVPWSLYEEKGRDELVLPSTAMWRLWCLHAPAARAQISPMMKLALPTTM